VPWAFSEWRVMPPENPAFRRTRLQRSSHISRIRSTFDGTKFPVIEMADLSFREIAVLIDSAARHENVTMDIALIAFRIWVMQAHAIQLSASEKWWGIGRYLSLGHWHNVRVRRRIPARQESILSSNDRLIANLSTTESRHAAQFTSPLLRLKTLRKSPIFSNVKRSSKSCHLRNPQIMSGITFHKVFRSAIGYAFQVSSGVRL